MNTSMRYFLGLVLILVFVPAAINAQESTWEWTWGNAVSTNCGNNAWMQMIGCDAQNNVCGRIHYDIELYFSDTSFLHPDHLFPFGNVAICSYDASGEMVKATDLYSEPMGWLSSGFIGTDSYYNQYIGVVFDKEINIYDTVFVNEEPPMTIAPHILLAKANMEDHVEWGKKITSPNQDGLIGMITSEEGSMYITARHMANTEFVQLDILGQHLTEPFDHNLNTIIKVDHDGILVWETEIRSVAQGTQGRSFLMGSDGYLHLLGNARNDFSVGVDTFYHPGSANNNFIFFLLKFAMDGTLEGGNFYEDDLFITDFAVDQYSDYFLAGFVEDTACIGGDTIIVPGDYKWWVIGKFDQNLNPLWYTLHKGVENIEIDLDDQNVVFAASGRSLVHIADTIIDLGGGAQNTMVGELDENGNLIKILTSACSPYFESTGLVLDNRKDILISGELRGSLPLVDDTLYSFNNVVSDAMMTKVSRYEPVSFEIGPDTSVKLSDSLVLSVDEDKFRSYLWSDGSTASTTTIIAEDLGDGIHAVWLTATDGPYSGSDTLMLTIVDDFGLNDEQGEEINIFPNPFRDVFIIEITPGFNTIEVYDMNGKKHHAEEISGSTGTYIVEMKNTPTGIYFLRISNQDRVLTKKIVKH